MSQPFLENTQFVVRSLAQTAVDNEIEFGELDAVVGDGDFGFSLARGFEKIIEGWEEIPRTDPAAFLQSIAMTISSRIGGTSGPIWGTAFLRAAGVARGSDDLGSADVVVMLRAAVEGIMQRGKAELGDKTLLDAIVPATDELERALADGADFAGALARMAVEARRSAEATSELQAMRGRASYSGVRSIGSPDAGAIAVAVILERLSAEWAARP